MKNRLIDYTAVVLILMFIGFLMLKPETCKNGIAYGILLCGRVIIPSLFPFTMCVLFILRSGVLNRFSFLNGATQRLFGIPFRLFSVFLLSAIGGYPVGAKLLNEAVQIKAVTQETAERMLYYCINAGPAFVVSAVGAGILGSVKLGYVLFLSNFFATFIMALFSGRFIKEKGAVGSNSVRVNAADNFVESTAQAAESVLGICGFVILFSGINSYINLLSTEFELLKIFSFLFEVTNAVTLTQNIFLISFLLGFGGISVWCQVLAVSKNIKINYIKFIFFRILHGTLSLLLTFLIIRIFGVAVPTLSNFKNAIPHNFYSTGAVAGAMLVMSIVFAVAITTKKYVVKITDDMV